MCVYVDDATEQQTITAYTCDEILGHHRATRARQV
jgi:hypothetical protein